MPSSRIFAPSLTSAKMQRSDDVLLVQRLPLDARTRRASMGARSGPPVGAVAGFVAVVAGTGLLPEHAGGAELSETVGKSRCAGGARWRFADRLADVETGQIAHGERSHGHAEIAQGSVDLLWRGAFTPAGTPPSRPYWKTMRLPTKPSQTPTTTETFQLLANRHGSGEHFIAGPPATHHFQQAHDIGRAEEADRPHPRAAWVKAAMASKSSDREVLEARIAPGLQHRIQLLEDLLLDAHLFEHGLDHHVGISQGAVVGDASDQREALPIASSVRLPRLTLAAFCGHAAGRAATPRH